MEEILASIRRIISDDQPAEAEAPKPMAVVSTAPPAEPVLSEEEDVLDLTSPVPAPATPAPVAVQPEPVAPPPPPPAPAVPLPPPPVSFAPAEPTEEQLLSQNAHSAVTNAFGSLAHTVLSHNARTIDDVVKDMLRPMLKAWLDDNLPAIVERLVRAEIERVARGGR